jgi:hypothetical protein
MPAIELSNAIEDSSRNRCFDSCEYEHNRAAFEATMPRCSTVTPFGVPVEPEV